MDKKAAVTTALAASLIGGATTAKADNIQWPKGDVTAKETVQLVQKQYTQENDEDCDVIFIHTNCKRDEGFAKDIAFDKLRNVLKKNNTNEHNVIKTYYKYKTPKGTAYCFVLQGGALGSNSTAVQ